MNDENKNYEYTSTQTHTHSHTEYKILDISPGHLKTISAYEMARRRRSCQINLKKRWKQDESCLMTGTSGNLCHVLFPNQFWLTESRECQMPSFGRRPITKGSFLELLNLDQCKICISYTNLS